MYIPKFTLEELSVVIQCGECGFRETADVVMGHMLEAHDYTVAQMERFVEDVLPESIKEQKLMEWDIAEDDAYERRTGENR